MSSIMLLLMSSMSFVVTSFLFAYDYRIIVFLGMPSYYYFLLKESNKLGIKMAAIGEGDSYSESGLPFIALIFYVGICLAIYSMQFNYAKLVVED